VGFYFPPLNYSTSRKGHIRYLSGVFKALYSKRSTIEQYNSRFKFLSNERLFVRNISSVKALSKISHICLALVAVASAKTHKFSFIRSLASFKRVA